METYTLAHQASNETIQEPNVRELGKSYMMYKIGEFNEYIFFKIFVGILIALFWTSGDFWVSKPERAALFTLGGGICVICSLRFTCGVTLANLLALPTEHHFKCFN